MKYMTREKLKNNILEILGPENKVEVFEYAKSHKPCVFINDDLMDKWTFNKKTGLDYDSIRIKNDNLVLWRELGNEVCNKKSTVK